jgi:zinc transporter, ZIP family
MSRRAGWILAIANCLEMSFLGMAVSMRVRKCTGSSLFVRYACIIVPPLIMLGATVCGAVVGSISKSFPILFVTFVAFGVIALLYLVFNELLAEAREAQEGDVRWWVTAVVFVGIYVVLMIDRVIDE